MKKSNLYKIGDDFWINQNNIENIIKNITNLSKTELFLSEEIPDKHIQQIKNNFERLNAWEPIEYIINNAQFYSLDFYVDNKVLIPRNDTEIMVDKALETIVNITPPSSITFQSTPLEKGRWNNENITLIDIWTWSSCIAISILKNTNKIKYSYVIDISSKALEVSKINLEKHSLTKKIIQIKSNLLQKLLWVTGYKISENIIITANLPYIKNKDFKNMDINTIKYEPSLALFWWEKTWFEIYENLIHQCQTLNKQFSNSKITLFIEIGFDQFDYSKQYLENIWLKWDYYKDNCWINRCIKIKF